MRQRMSEQRKSGSEGFLGALTCLSSPASLFTSHPHPRPPVSGLHPITRVLFCVWAFALWLSVSDAAFGAAPANDKFAAAQLLQGVEGAVSGSNAGASGQPGEPVHGLTGSGKSIWYRWHPPFNVRATFSTLGSSPDTVLAVYTGMSVSTLTLLTSSDDATAGSRFARVTFNAYDSVDYWIAVDTTAPESGLIQLLWTSVPANDRFSNFRLLTGSSGVQRGSSFGASLDPGEVSEGGPDVTATVWFAWASLMDGDVTLETAGSDFDTVVSVYVGDDLSGLSLIASDDNSGDDGITSRVSFHADLGGRYRIVLGGRHGSQGSYRLTWHQVSPPPDNDDFATARLVRSTTGQVIGSTDGATAEVGEPLADGLPPIFSVWFRWMAPRSGSAFFCAQGSLLAAEVRVYTGNDFTDLILVGAGEDRGTGESAVARFEAVEGMNYWISLDSEDATTGPYTLAWNFDDLRTSNNALAHAKRLIGFSGVVSGENYRADNEPGEPLHAGDEGGRSVWFRWVAPASFRVVFETRHSNFDTLLAVYTGEDFVSGLTPIASNDDFERQLTSRLSFEANAGVAYLIAVDSSTDNGYKIPEIGAIELSWSPTHPDSLILYPTKGMLGTRICIGVANLDQVTGVTLGGLSADFYIHDGALNAFVPPGATTGAIEVTFVQADPQSSLTDFVVLPGTPPALSIALGVDNLVRLSWPTSSPEFVLQWTDDLSDNGVWRSGPPADQVGLQWISNLSVNPKARTRFYRLTLP